MSSALGTSGLGQWERFSHHLFPAVCRFAEEELPAAQLSLEAGIFLSQIKESSELPGGTSEMDALKTDPSPWLHGFEKSTS